MRGMKVIKGAECRDLDNDGIDELIVHYTPSTTKKAEASASALQTSSDLISIFSLKTYRKIKTFKRNIAANGLAILDIDGNGTTDLCTYANQSNGSSISCIFDGSDNISQVFTVPMKIDQFTGGTFIRDESGDIKDGFAILNKRNSTDLRDSVTRLVG